MSRALRTLEETERTLATHRDQRSQRGTHRQNFLPMQFSSLLGRGEFNSNDYEVFLKHLLIKKFN